MRRVSWLRLFRGSLPNVAAAVQGPNKLRDALHLRVCGPPLRMCHHALRYWEQRPDCIRGCEAKMWVSIVFNVDEVMKEDIKIKHIMLRFPDSVVHEIVTESARACSHYSS